MNDFGIVSVIVLFVSVSWFCAIVGKAIGQRKNQPMAGMILGMLLGFFGLILALLLPYVPDSDDEWTAADEQKWLNHLESQKRKGKMSVETPHPDEGWTEADQERWMMH